MLNLYAAKPCVCLQFQAMSLKLSLLSTCPTASWISWKIEMETVTGHHKSFPGRRRVDMYRYISLLHLWIQT